MKKFIKKTGVLVCSLIGLTLTSYAQVHFVPVSVNDSSYCARIIENATPRNFDVNIMNGSAGPNVIKKYKNNETPNWNLISKTTIPASDIAGQAAIKTFLYNGKTTIAYRNNNNASIIIAQWDEASSQFTPIMPLLTPMYPGNFNFDVSVNPINNEIYVAHEHLVTTTSISVYHYNGTAWILDLSQFNPFDPSYSLNQPRIYFADSALYLGGIANDTLRIYEQNYTNFNAGSLISLATSNPMSIKASVFSMSGLPSQPPYLAVTNYTTGNVVLSNVQNNLIIYQGNTTITGLSAGRVDLAFKNGNPQVLISNKVGTNIQTQLLELSGNALVNNYPDVDNTTGTVTLKDISLISTADGLRNFATVTLQIGTVSRSSIFASNNKPTITNNIYDDTICYMPGADYNKTLLVSNITFSDVEEDNIFITAITPSNPLILDTPLSAYTIEKTAQIGGLTTYKIYSNNVFAAGTTSLTIRYTDGYDIDSVIISNIVSVTGANPPTTLTNNLSSINPKYCNNASAIDLTQATQPYPGIIYVDGQVAEGGVYPTNQFTGSELFVFSYLDISTGCYSNLDMLQPVQVMAPTASATTTPTDCNINNGTATLTYTVGSASVNDIYWSAGFHDSLSLSNLYAGQYLITVTDINDCIATAIANVALNGMTVSENIINAICAGDNNGSIQLTVSGSDAPYTYLWSTGQSTSSIYNLEVGDYEVVITSASGCQMVKTYTVAQPFGPLVINDYSPYPPDCNMANGQLDASPTGGLSPYSFTWNTGATTQTLNGLVAGIYHVKVTDVLGCSTEKDVILDDYATPNVFATSIVQPSCGLANGSIAAELTDMTEFASVSWNNGATSMFNGNLNGGHYTCEAKTSAGCKVYKSWTLNTETPLQNNICMLTVDSATNTNLIVWEKVQTNVDHYNIYREGSVAGQFLLIDTVSGLNHSIFNDVVASPKTHSWRYKISAVNQCGAEGPLSMAHKTVHLVISQSIGTQYNISWDQYEGFSYSTVNLWRYTNVNGWEMLSALSSNIFSYTDDLLSIDPTGLDYMIEILPPSTCFPDKAQDYNSSRSNKANSIMVPGAGTGASNNGIAEYSDELPLLIYPNPTKGVLNLEWKGETTHYQVVDIQGKIIATSTVQEGKSIIDLSNVLSGIYFLKINNRTSKIIVE